MGNSPSSRRPLFPKLAFSLDQFTEGFRLQVHLFCALLCKDFPEECGKVYKSIGKGAHLNDYFQDDDVKYYGSPFLSAVVNTLVYDNNRYYFRKAYEYALAKFDNLHKSVSNMAGRSFQGSFHPSHYVP